MNKTFPPNDHGKCVYILLATMYQMQLLPSPQPVTFIQNWLSNLLSSNTHVNKQKQHEEFPYSLT